MFKFTDNIIAQMTLQCNMHCKYCYEGSKIKEHKKFLTVPDFKEALDLVIYEKCILGKIENPVLWHFHGGEPLLYNWEDFKECVRYIHRRQRFFPNVSYCIQTNGTLLDDEKAEFFAKENLTIGYSFDGFEGSERLSKEENEKLIENLRYLHNTYGIKLHCLSVLSKKNMRTWFSDMKKISDFTESCGINVLVPDEDHDDLAPSAEDQWEYWLKPCLESLITDNPLFERYVNIVVERFFSSVVCQVKKDDCKKSGCFNRICGHGINMISIDPDLKVHNCDKYLEEGKYIEERFESNFKERDFLGLQQIKRYAHYCKDLFSLENKYDCDNCYAEEFCLGGCQSYNLSRYGELRFDDSMCEIYERIYQFLRLHWIDILKKRPVRLLGEVEKINPEFLRELKDYNLPYKLKIDSSKNIILLEERD